jgi:heat shock protein HslJ
MRIKSILLPIVGFFLLSLAACGVNTGTDPLEGTSWVLIEYDKLQSIEGTTLTVNFADGQIIGSSGCNSYYGNYEVNGKKISFSSIDPTAMYCFEPEGVMEQEQAFLEHLRDAKTFRISNSQLRIFNLNRKSLIFVME